MIKFKKIWGKIREHLIHLKKNTVRIKKIARRTVSTKKIEKKVLSNNKIVKYCEKFGKCKS